MSDPSQPSPAPSPTYQLADLLLEEGVREFVTSRRKAGVAWRRISRELWERTDHRVDVAHETLRNWFPGDFDSNGDTEPETKAS